MAHTTVADYVRRPRFRYQPPLVNYAREADAVRAVPMGEGFIDYRTFLRTLRECGYQGYVAYEMCSPLRGGGSEENLDRCARRFWSIWPPSDADAEAAGASPPVSRDRRAGALPLQPTESGPEGWRPAASAYCPRDREPFRPAAMGLPICSGRPATTMSFSCR